MLTATQHTHAAAGHPPHGYTETATGGRCATCGGDLHGVGITLADIETPTMASHADNFRVWGKYCCRACAWLYHAGKGRPGNFIALPWQYEETVISLESVVANKRPWLAVLRELSAVPPETPITGVMTTDVKPRLWPRMRLASIGAAGLYVHAPDYDVSAWIRFDLGACLNAIDAITPALAAGYAKARCYHGLLTDSRRALRDPAAALALDAAIAVHRGRDHFLPALIAAGITKETKANAAAAIAEPKSSGRAYRQPKSAAASGDPPAGTQLGLF